VWRDAACASWLYAPERPAQIDWSNVPLFMDIHSIGGGVSAEDVADAHARDLEHQHSHGVNYLRYWVDEHAGKVFCLVEAPSADAACEVHREAHGVVADEIYQVSEYS